MSETHDGHDRFRAWCLMQRYWTGGTKTDVRAKDAACVRWERREL